MTQREQTSHGHNLVLANGTATRLLHMAGVLLWRPDKRPDQRRLRVNEVPNAFASEARHWYQPGRRHQFQSPSRRIEVHVHLLTHNIEQSLLRLDERLP